MGKSKKALVEVGSQQAKSSDVATVTAPLRLVLFTAGGSNVNIPQKFLPAAFQGEKMQTGSFKPSAEWTSAGECIAGTFQRIRQEVGPNNSNLYEIVVDDPQLLKGQKPFEASFWGSTQLDDLFFTHEPPVTGGDKVLVTYIGTKPTKRGLNPVKLFTLIVIPGKKKAA